MNTLILVIIVVLQFAYIVYQDILNRKEREKLQLKLMSRSVEEYKEAVEPPAKEAKPEPNPYKNTSDVSTEKLMKAEDNI